MESPHLLKLHVLASGSKGNCSVIEGPQGCLMIDNGLTRKTTLERLGTCGIKPEHIKAILLTHEHNDHIQGLKVWSNAFNTPIYGPKGISHSTRKALSGLKVTEFNPESTFLIAGININAFSTSHDVSVSCGFRFDYQDDSIGFATDTGTLSQHSQQALYGTRILALESNHDLTMLKNNVDYPRYLKERIASATGHLSNQQASQYASKLVSSSTEYLVGMHLSQNNNSPLLVIKTFASNLKANMSNIASEKFGFFAIRDNLRICAASQNRPLTFQ